MLVIEILVSTTSSKMSDPSRSRRIDQLEDGFSNELVEGRVSKGYSLTSA